MSRFTNPINGTYTDPTFEKFAGIVHDALIHRGLMKEEEAKKYTCSITREIANLHKNDHVSMRLSYYQLKEEDVEQIAKGRLTEKDMIFHRRAINTDYNVYDEDFLEKNFLCRVREIIIYRLNYGGADKGIYTAEIERVAETVVRRIYLNFRERGKGANYPLEFLVDYGLYAYGYTDFKPVSSRMTFERDLKKEAAPDRTA